MKCPELQTENRGGSGGWRPPILRNPYGRVKGEERLVLRNLSSKGQLGLETLCPGLGARGVGGERPGMCLDFGERGCTGIPTWLQLPSLRPPGWVFIH